MSKYGLFVVFVMMHLAAMGQVNVVPDTVASAEMRYTFCFAEGLRTKMLGNMDEAIGFFEKCIALNPDKGEPYYELAMLRAGKGDYAGATGYARNAWKRDNRNKFYGQLLIECLAHMDQPAECIPVYQELQKTFPDEVGYQTGEAEVMIQAKQYKEALNLLKKLGRNPGLSRWSIVRQRDVYEISNRNDKGIRVIEKWLLKNPGDFELRGVLAEAYAANGQKEKALEQYAELKKQSPDYPAISFSLGQYYYQEGEMDKALNEFLQGFRSTSVNPMIKMEIIEQYLQAQENKQKPDSSVVRLIEVLYETDRGDPSIDALYANYLYSEDRMDEAEPIYYELTVKDPGNFVVWQNLLFILNEKQDFERMERVSDEAIKVFPSQGLFYLFKGIAATVRTKYQEAVAALNKGISFPGQNPEIIKQFYISLGDALYKAGNTEESFKNYDLLLGLEPENGVVLNNYSYFLSLENRDLDKALMMIQKCIGAEKDNPTYLDTYAWVLFKRGEFKKALEPMQQAIDLNKTPSGEVLEHYGDILFYNGREAEARTQWIRARETGEASADIVNKIEKGLTR